MEIILDQEDLETRLDDLGEKLTKICNHEGGGIVFICVMKGGFMFFSDLVKRIEYPIEVDFIRCSSYDGQAQQTLQIHTSVDVNVKGKTVFIVDDILDTGNTMNELVKHFITLGAKGVETVAAIYKENEVLPNTFHIYKQPENVNPWYVGYGMDDPKGYQRNLNKIKTL
jgi:hypoxanthine phosphoribosyltransferase